MTTQNTEIMSLSEAREILGRVGESMTDLEIQQIVSVFQLLCDSWLDNRERNLFQGKTLKELLT